MVNSYRRFYEKLRSEGIFDPRERDMSRGFNSQITNNNVFGLISVTVKYLSQNEITFTEEEINDFVERHSVEGEDGSKSFEANSTTNSIKDFILLTLAQDQMNYIRNGALLKYLAVCQPEIYNHLPGVKEVFLKKEEFVKNREDTRQPFLRLRAHKNLSSLLGNPDL